MSVSEFTCISSLVAACSEELVEHSFSETEATIVVGVQKISQWRAHGDISRQEESPPVYKVFPLDFPFMLVSHDLQLLPLCHTLTDSNLIPRSFWTTFHRAVGSFAHQVAMIVTEQQNKKVLIMVEVQVVNTVEDDYLELQPVPDTSESEEYDHQDQELIMEINVFGVTVPLVYFAQPIILYEEVIRLVANESIDDNGLRVIPASSSSVEELETKKFEEGEVEEICVVCLDELVKGVDVTKMPCSHVFHRECIFKWFEKRYTCPICRFKMPIDS